MKPLRVFSVTFQNTYERFWHSGHGVTSDYETYKHYHVFLTVTSKAAALFAVKASYPGATKIRVSVAGPV